jgi:hypothetical protein
MLAFNLRYIWLNPADIGWTFGVAAGGDSGQADKVNVSSYPRFGTGTTATPM